MSQPKKIKCPPFVMGCGLDSDDVIVMIQDGPSLRLAVKVVDDKIIYPPGVSIVESSDPERIALLEGCIKNCRRIGLQRREELRRNRLERRFLAWLPTQANRSDAVGRIARMSERWPSRFRVIGPWEHDEPDWNAEGEIPTQVEAVQVAWHEFNKGQTTPLPYGLRRVIYEDEETIFALNGGQ